MRQRWTGKFPVPDPLSPLVMVDEIAFSPLVAARTTGVGLIIPAFIGGPKVSENWEIISVSVQASLMFANFNNAGFTAVSAFGRFGRIFAGVSMDELVTTPPQQSFLGPIPQPPSDLSLTVDIWNPDIDPMPPTRADATGTFAPQLDQTLLIGGTISPPNPLQLFEGVQPSVGIWMTPSLLGAGANAVPPNLLGLTLFYASFAVNYDDGL